MAGAVLGEVQVSLFVAGAVLGEVQVSLFVAGAVLGEVQVSLFVAGALLGEVQVSLFVAGAVFGEVQVALLVAGAVFGEGFECKIGRETLYFSIRKMLVVSSKSNPSVARRVAVCVFMLGSFSDHARIILGSWSDRPRIGNDVSPVFGDFL